MDYFGIIMDQEEKEKKMKEDEGKAKGTIGKFKTW